MIDDWRKLAEIWQQSAVVAVDTEFMRRNSYFHRPGLVQVASSKGTALLDPCSLRNWQPFKSLMMDSAVIKLMHAAHEDVELLRSCYGIAPEKLLDSQIAVSLVSERAAVSYQWLVEHYLQVRLEKDEARSDWLQRPLSAAQLSYAAQDVHYLMHCYQFLRRDLEAKGRLAWALEDSRRLVGKLFKETCSDLLYLEMKGAWKLSPPGLRKLRRLCAWREQIARQQDMPRAWVVSDNSLLLMAQKSIRRLADLKQLAELHSKRIRLHGDELLTLLLREDVQEQDLIMPDPPLGSAQRRRLSQLRAFSRTRAEALGIAPEVLVRKKELETIVRGRKAIAEVLTGWRWQELGHHLLQFHEGSHAPAM